MLAMEVFRVSGTWAREKGDALANAAEILSNVAWIGKKCSCKLAVHESTFEQPAELKTMYGRQFAGLKKKPTSQANKISSRSVGP